MGLQTGIYRVIVRKQGFRPAYKENIRPESGEESTVDFEPGPDRKLPFEMTQAEIEQLKRSIL